MFERKYTSSAPEMQSRSGEIRLSEAFFLLPVLQKKEEEAIFPENIRNCNAQTQETRMRAALLLAAIGTGALLATGCATDPRPDPSLLRTEADNFRAAFSGTADRQIEAIRRAVSGDRAMLDAIRMERRTETPPPPGIAKADTLIPSASGTLPLRIYHPARPDEPPRPMVIYLHGGGWVIGSIESASRVAGELAARSGAVVLVPEYRLAPESPYPAALDDLMAVIRFVHDLAPLYGGDPLKIVLAGDSAGGNLALAAALRLARTGKPRAAGLILFYPVTTLVPEKSGSYLRYGRGYALDSRLMETFATAYHPADDCRDNPEISPLYGNPGELPPFLLVTAERDILHDQGTALAEKAAAAGVRVEHLDLPGATHLFITMPGMDCAFEQALSAAVNFIGTL